ncbi:MAG: hypothetical protein M1814_001506 [Vezdaea aestivalis]|nr:MAG: hypothetical protein M1814_001506 [Vezdaea aestivalis]
MAAFSSSLLSSAFIGEPLALEGPSQSATLSSTLPPIPVQHEGLSDLSPPTREAPHVAIIGAGIAGLVTAQALLKAGIPFTIYERDTSSLSRGTGWGLTIHWALPALEWLLPESILARLPDVSVDPDVIFNGEGNFLFIELGSGRIKWKVPPNRRVRVRRSWFRDLLMENVAVQWGKTLKEIGEIEDSERLRLTFENGHVAEADVVLGCDGSRSITRSLICPAHRNFPLPVCLFGATVVVPRQEAERIRVLDPLFLQGSDAKTDVFFYFSFLETPRNNPAKTDTYTCQVMMSWPHRAGFRGQAEPTDMPDSDAERLALMKTFAKDWAEPFGSLIAAIREGTEVKPVQLEDWPTESGGWNDFRGRCTLIGDAAHAMTMYRGEGANHAIEDVKVLLEHLIPAMKEESISLVGQATMPDALAEQDASHHSLMSMTPSPTTSSFSDKASTAPTSAPSPASDADGSYSRKLSPVNEAVRGYQAEMFVRGKAAVLASRQACLDGHEYERIGDESPLIAMRKKINAS